jgi:DNA adenine methylase
LRERLDKLKGKFVLSLDDRPEVRRIFAGFRIRGLKTSYTSQQRAGRRYGEVLILNFDPAPSRATTAEGAA